MLASGSIYRERMLRDAGFELIIDPPHVDERAADHLLARLGPGGLAVELAARKAASVAVRHSQSIVLGGDQVGVVQTPRGPVQLNKQPDSGAAVAQLMSLSGTTHHLYNGMVLLDVPSGCRVSGIDVQRVTMRAFGAEEALEYVQRFEPLDTAGSYRMEDSERMAPLEPFVTSVVGEDPTGVLGVPIPMLRRLLVSLEDATRGAAGRDHPHGGPPGR